MRTLLDCDKHDVADTYYTAQQGEESYYPESRVQETAALVHLHILGELVPDEVCAVVIGGCAVAGVEYLLDACLECLVLSLGVKSVESEGYHLQVIAHSEYGPCGGVGDIEVAVVSVLLGMTHTYYGEYQVAYLESLAQQRIVVGTALKQILGQHVRDYHHLTFLGNIQIVYESAGKHIDAVHVDLSRECAVQTHVVDMFPLICYRESAF